MMKFQWGIPKLASNAAMPFLMMYLGAVLATGTKYAIISMAYQSEIVSITYLSSVDTK